MAPAFLGEHFMIQCRDCQKNFPVDATKIPNHRMATCPNCGFSENPYGNLSEIPATKISLREETTPLKRWDVLAFRFPNSQQNGIKRLAGLPNESVTINEGNVFIDGELATRSWDCIHQMKVPVFDSKFRPRSAAKNGQSRFEMTGPWQLQDGEYRLLPAKNEPSQGELHFQPIQCFRGPENRKPVDFIFDDYGYNQTISRVHLHPVNELFVQLDLQLGSNSKFEICLPGKAKEGFRCVITGATQQLTLYSGVDEVDRVSFNSSQECNLGLSTIDGIPRVFINGNMVIQADQPNYRIDLAQGFALAQSPVIIRASSSKKSPLRIGRIQIFRDVYYTPRGRSEFQLGADEYFVLGDNSPVSVDSRTWSKPTISNRQIHGVVRLSED